MFACCPCIPYVLVPVNQHSTADKKQNRNFYSNELTLTEQKSKVQLAPADTQQG